MEPEKGAPHVSINIINDLLILDQVILVLHEPSTLEMILYGAQHNMDILFHPHRLFVGVSVSIPSVEERLRAKTYRFVEINLLPIAEYTNGAI